MIGSDGGLRCLRGHHEARVGLAAGSVGRMAAPGPPIGLGAGRSHLCLDLGRQAGVAGEAEHQVHAVRLAPGYQRITGKAAVGAQHNAPARSSRTDMRAPRIMASVRAIDEQWGLATRFGRREASGTASRSFYLAPESADFAAPDRIQLAPRLCFGVEKGPHWRGDRRPKGTLFLMGFTMALGTIRGLYWDVNCGEDSEDPSCPSCPGQIYQGDLPGTCGFSEGCAQGPSVGGDRVPL